MGGISADQHDLWLPFVGGAQHVWTPTSGTIQRLLACERFGQCDWSCLDLLSGPVAIDGELARYFAVFFGITHTPPLRCVARSLAGVMHLLPPHACTDPMCFRVSTVIDRERRTVKESVPIRERRCTVCTFQTSRGFTSRLTAFGAAHVAPVFFLPVLAKLCSGCSFAVLLAESQRMGLSPQQVGTIVAVASLVMEQAHILEWRASAGTAEFVVAERVNIAGVADQELQLVCVLDAQTRALQRVFTRVVAVEAALDGAAPDERAINADFICNFVAPLLCARATLVTHAVRGVLTGIVAARLARADVRVIAVTGPRLPCSTSIGTTVATLLRDTCRNCTAVESRQPRRSLGRDIEQPALSVSNSMTVARALAYSAEVVTQRATGAPWGRLFARVLRLGIDTRAVLQSVFGAPEPGVVYGTVHGGVVVDAVRRRARCRGRGCRVRGRSLALRTYSIPKPSWQQAPGVGTITGRGEPDVSANADIESGWDVFEPSRTGRRKEPSAVPRRRPRAGPPSPP